MAGTWASFGNKAGFATILKIVRAPVFLKWDDLEKRLVLDEA